MKLYIAQFFAPILYIGVVGGAILPSIADAAESWDVGFQPHLEVGVADYALDFSATSQVVPPRVVSTGKLSLSETMPTISAGWTLFADHFFLDLAVQRMQTYNQSLSDSHTIYTSTLGSLETTQESYSSDDFTRDEYTLSLGYGITDSFSVYAGYKKQYTDIKDVVGTGPIEIVSSNPNPNLPPNYVYGTFDTFTNIGFDYDGPFAGATAGWKINNGILKGRISMSAAVAFLQGSLRANSSSASVKLGAVTVPVGITLADILDTDGDTVGVTLGTSWLGQTDIAGLYYTIALNGYNYDFSADINGRPEVNESVLQLKMGLAYAF